MRILHRRGRRPAPRRAE